MIKVVISCTFLLFSCYAVLLTRHVYLRALPGPTPSLLWVNVQVVDEDTANRRDEVTRERINEEVPSLQQTALLAVLTAVCIALSHICVKDKNFQKLRNILGATFFGCACLLVLTHFEAFAFHHSYYHSIHDGSKVMLTILAAILFLLSLIWAGGETLGAVFLLVALALIFFLVHHAALGSVEMTDYGYFFTIFFLVLLAGGGAFQMLKGRRAFDA